MPILNRKETNDILSQNPRVNVCIDFPTAIVPDGDGFFKGTKTTEDAIKSNIRLFILTQRGERLMQPNLGTELRDVLFEQINEGTILKIQDVILDAIQVWLPFVDIRDIQIRTNDDEENIDKNVIRVKIIFNLNKDPNTIDSVNVDFTGGIDEDLGGSTIGQSSGTGAY